MVEYAATISLVLFCCNGASEHSHPQNYDRDGPIGAKPVSRFSEPASPTAKIEAEATRGVRTTNGQTKSEGTAESWSQILREGMQAGEYDLTIPDGCIVVEANSTLGRKAGANASTRICSAHASSSFLELRSQSDLVERAKSMTPAQRAAMQSHLRETHAMWPDDYKGADSKAANDKVPAPPRQSVNDAVQTAVDSARKLITQAREKDFDLQPIVYAIVAEELARIIFDEGCRRNFYDRTCPLGWALRTSEDALVCEPPATYRGLCSQLDLSSLTNRSKIEVRAQLRRLSRICWAEWPCVDAPAYDFSHCPANYHLLIGTPDDTDWCLRNRDFGTTTTVIRFPHSMTREEKIRYAYLLNEPWPELAPSTPAEIALAGELAPSAPLPKTNHKATSPDPLEAGPIDPRSGIVASA